MRVIAMLVAAVCSSSAALASGGLNCGAADPSAKFEVMAGVTRGLGGPAFNFRGELEIRAASVPADMRKLGFEHGNLAQYWLDAKELRLLIYRERSAAKVFGETELEIRAEVAGDEGLYGGLYTLTVFEAGDGSSEGKTSTFSGIVSCFVE